MSLTFMATVSSKASAANEPISRTCLHPCGAQKSGRVEPKLLYSVGFELVSSPSVPIGVRAQMVVNCGSDLFRVSIWPLPKAENQTLSERGRPAVPIAMGWATRLRLLSAGVLVPELRVVAVGHE